MVKKAAELKGAYNCPECKERLIRGILDGKKVLWCKKCRKSYKAYELKPAFEELPGDEQVRIVKQIFAWNEARGRNLYRPNHKEYWFFLQPHRVKSISGANRSGKTCTAAIDMVMQAEGWHPLQRENLARLALNATDKQVREHCSMLYDEARWIQSGALEMRCVATDFPNGVEKMDGPEYIKWASKGELKYVGFDNEKRRRITWNNGSYVEFMTHDQDLDSHGGVARHAIHFDEEAPYEYWVENSMRIMSYNGRMLYTATAVEGISWSDEEIFQKGEQGSKDVYFMELTSYDNPVNTKEVVDNIKKLCRTDQDVQVRIYGKRFRRGGLVFDMAKDEYPWVIPDFKIPEKNGVLLLMADIHPKTEQALLWIWVDYEGNIEVDNGNTFDLIDGKPNLYECGEVFAHADMRKMAYLIEKKETELGRTHDYFILEPAAWVSDSTKEVSKSAADQLVDLGLSPEKGSKDLQGGLIYVKELLSVENYVDETKYDHPRLMTFESLERTRWEAKNYHYPKPSGRTRIEDQPIKQKPVDRDDHMMEDRRRGCEYFVEHEYNLERIKERPPMRDPVGNIIDVEYEENEIELFDI